MRKNKRAVSAIVATVLIIALTIGLLALIGPPIINMVRDQIEGGPACTNAALGLSIKTEGYTCFTVDNETEKNGTLNVQVSYGAEDVGLVGIYILPKVGGSDLDKYLVNESLPSTGLTKVIKVNLTEKPDEVAIMPIVKVGNTEKECSATDYVTVLNC